MNIRPVKLRPVDPETDFPRLAELMSMFEPEPVTAEDLRRWQEQASAERIHHRMAALDEHGKLVGFNNVIRDPWMAAGLFWANVIVDLVMHRQGIGSLLYADALQFAQHYHATSLKAEVRDDLPDSLRFAERRGFKIDRHLFESTLDLQTFNERRFAGLVESVESGGIRFFSLADLGNTLEAQRKLYEINRRYALDIPGGGQDFPPFEQFQKDVFAAPWYRADAEIVAADEDRWVGLAAAGYFPTNNYMYNMITGVEPSYRGRHIALALKLLVIECARRYSAAYLRTNNDSENAPMLAVNRKLGYQPQPGRYLLIQNLP